MNWRQRLTQNLLYGGLTREDYLRVRDTVLEHNRSYVVVWCFVLGGFWIYSLLMSMGSEAYANCRMAYAGGLACCVFALYGAAFVAPHWKWIRLPLIVFFDIAFLGASIGIAVFQPDVRTITMFVAAIIVPICYIERTILTIILLLINLTAYIFIAKGPIEPGIYSWGLGNLIIFSTGGTLIGHVINRSRFERYVYEESVKKLAEMKIAKEAADRSSQAKSDFLASMSHEIRTPINAMLGMNEMVLRESAEAGAQEGTEGNPYTKIHDYSVMIDNAGRGLLSIVNDILDFSRIESGRMKITEKEYSLSSVLNDLCTMYAMRAEEKNLIFNTRIDSRIPDRLYGDEVRLKQIMYNLLSNAFKYTSEGSVTLTVQRAEESSSRDRWKICLEISVEDTGTGIKEEDMPKLFTKFERMDLKKNSTVEGAGLGLAITRRLLELMDGTIQVESVYGEGSVFRVTLPQRVVSEEPMGTLIGQKPQDRPEDRQPFRAPDARILAVDDTRINLLVTVGLLKETGIRIDTAPGGQEAIRLAEENAYDLILMDQRMPEMDGAETMHRIRSAGGPNTQTPFICLTADAVSGARERYLAEGFTDYLSKPVSGGELERAVRMYLPEGKVLPVEKKTAKTENETAGEVTGCDAALRQAGIDPEAGLASSGGKADLYLELLCEFGRDADGKNANLRRCYEAEDWVNYTVYVHALKSSARLIGAKKLSGMAAKLENAAREKKEKVVRAGHDALTAEYDRVAEAVRTAPFFEENEEPEPEILDFPVAGS